jgi:hypothetical protein
MIWWRCNANVGSKRQRQSYVGDRRTAVKEAKRLTCILTRQNCESREKREKREKLEKYAALSLALPCFLLHPAPAA